MKNIKTIIIFVFSIVLTSGISIYATSEIMANKIIYKDGTVESALNYLYDNIGKVDLSNVVMSANSYEGEKVIGETTSINLAAGSYLVVGLEVWPSPVTVSANNNTESWHGTTNHPQISYDNTKASCTKIDGYHSRVVPANTYDSKLYRQYTAVNNFVCVVNESTDITITESMAGSGDNKLPMSIIVEAFKLN